MNDFPQTSSRSFLLRILAGTGGGIFGTFVFFAVYFLSSILFPASQSDVLSESGISVFAVISIVFLGTLSTNMVTGILLGYADLEKYGKQLQTLTHIFSFNMVFFLMTIPFYLLFGGNDPQNAQNIAAFHLLLSAMGSSLLADMVAGESYRVTAVYGTIFGGFISIAIVGLLPLNHVVQSTTLIFFAMPLVWFFLTSFTALSEMIAPNVKKYI